MIMSPQSKYWGDVPPCPIGIDAPDSNCVISVTVVGCVIGCVCSPTPRVMWTRLARPLNDRSSMPADEFGQELVISDVHLEDSGHYQCSASNSVDSPVTHVITLAVECRFTAITVYHLLALSRSFSNSHFSDFRTSRTLAFSPVFQFDNAAVVFTSLH